MNKTCPCATPPGGTITCRVDQMAICGVINGEPVSGCFDPPGGLTRVKGNKDKQQRLANWVLSMITGSYRSEQADITEDDMKILKDGAYLDPSTNTNVKFSAPEDLDLDELDFRRPLARMR